MKQTKQYQGRIQFKADSDETGEFTCEFATLNVKDHDGDVTVPGAFHDGQETIIEAWNHTYDQLPVGKAVIHEVGSKARAEGDFFLNTQGGLEHYRVVKQLGALQEWSYTFEIEKSEQGAFDGEKVRLLRGLDVWGVAPVQRGAGIDTRTVAIKGEKRALASHSTATSDAAWDGPANEARARSDEDVPYYQRIYAWRDPDGDPGIKSTYRFIHHEVGADGAPGAANIRACQTGIAILNGARGGTTIPDADRQGVWAHLARHLRDADLEPPELKSAKTGARHTAKEYEQIQQIHDLAVALGAKCAEGADSGGEGDGGPEGKSEDETGNRKSSGTPSGPRPSALAVRVAAELLEMGDTE
jgi:hypothetical protein